MHRFFVLKESIEDDSATVLGPPVHQIRNVLRLQPHDRIILLDNTGFEYDVELLELGKVAVKGRVIRKTRVNTEAKTRVVLYQAVLKGERFDLVLQKCTELGVSALVPLLCERSVAGRGVTSQDSRFVRWQKILQEAAEQSHRGILPELREPINYSQAMAALEGFSLLAWEGEEKTSLHDAIAGFQRESGGQNPATVNLFIGPEGGFSQKEASLARGHKVNPFSLGPRILRAETAAIVAVSLVLYELGDMQPQA